MAESDDQYIDASGSTLDARFGLAEPPTTSGKPFAQGDVLQRGATIGRYVVLERLGAGAMGVVYGAYDPELDRKVALKLVLSTGGRRGAHTRLLREAQGLAKLSHPNVVAVHDVGRVGDEVWIAMEFVRGMTLSEWRRETRPDHSAILSAMIDAGRGLAAAHHAGLVHRDFKPDNVMLGDDGRVRVMDFGLVRPHDVEEADEAKSGAEDVTAALKTQASPRIAALAIDLTRADAVVGTPAYMAPEQFAGADATAASDQFAFCVSLWEQLYGERPFAGSSLVHLAAAVLSGDIRSPPPGSSVPRHVRRVCERGLETDASARWPSMAELLDQLERKSASRWLSWALIGILGLGIALTLVVRSRQADDVTSCSGSHAAVAAIWDDTRRDALGAIFAATGAPYADAAASRVQAGLDDYTDRWVATRREACEAHVGGLTSDSAYDRQSICLDRHLAGVDALVGVLTEGDAEVLARADGLVASLPDLRACADIEALSQSNLDPPEDQRRKVNAIRDSLEHVRTLELAGRYTAAANDAMALLGDAEASGFPAVVAEVRYWHGVLQGRIGDLELAEATLLSTLAASIALEHKELAAATAVALVEVIDAGGRYAEALRWVQIAEPMHTRAGAGAGTEREAAAQVTFATVELHAGEYDAATNRLERALSLMPGTSADENAVVVPLLTTLAKVHQERYQPAHAEALLERALEILGANFGPEHPRSAELLDKLGASLGMQGRDSEAEVHLRRALEIRERALGSDHLLVAEILNNLAVVLSNQGKQVEAEAIYARAIEVIETSAGSEHPSLAYPLTGLGVVYIEEERCAEALPLFERALEINRRTYEPGHKALAFPVLNIAACNSMLERHEAAAKGYREGLALLTRATGESNVNVARIHRDLGEELIALERFADAADELRRSLEIFDALGEPRFSEDRAKALFLSAQALRGERPRDAEARREVKRRALEAREAVVDSSLRDLIDLWLDEPPLQRR